MNYPEHEKLSKISNISQMLGEFIEWLHDEEMSICSRQRNDDGDVIGFWPVRFSINELLAMFFDIDLVALEKEKRQMLEEIRNDNKD